MKKMEECFIKNPTYNYQTAERLGIRASVFLEYLGKRIAVAKKNNADFYEGFYWIRSSIREFECVFPWWSTRQLRNITDKLEKSEVIKTGFFNKSRMTNTKWYTIKDPEILSLFVGDQAVEKTASV